MTRPSASDIAESTQWLHERLDDHPGEVLLILRHLSASGASRRITPLIIVDQANRLTNVRYLGWHVSRVAGWAWNGEEQSVKVGGGGVDMGFHLVSSLSQLLYRDAYRLRHRWL